MGELGEHEKERVCFTLFDVFCRRLTCIGQFFTYLTIVIMLKQKSRVYQRYPGIVGGENEFPLQRVDEETTKGQPKSKNQCLRKIEPIPSPLFIPVLVLMGILSLAAFVVLPILSVILTEVPYRFALWYPALAMLTIWLFTVSCNWPDFFYIYLICYHMPLFLFYLFGSFQSAGIIDWSWIRICVPLYPMVILVPASFSFRKHFRKLSMIGT